MPSHAIAVAKSNHTRLRLLVGGLAMGAALLSAALANAQTSPFKLGATVPESLTFTDTSGNVRTFGEFRGKPVVLEWTNPECPFVVKHYASGNMQKRQTEATSAGTVWVTVNSGAAGKQGHLAPATAAAEAEKLGYKSSVVVPDAEGKLGRAFGAETTPHMFILNPTGKLVYMGAIDSIPSFDAKDIAKADNYVSLALAEVKAGKSVTTAQTKSYGCSVKY